MSRMTVKLPASGIVDRYGSRRVTNDASDTYLRDFAFHEVIQITQKHTKKGVSETLKITQRGRTSMVGVARNTSMVGVARNTSSPDVGDAIGLLANGMGGPCITHLGVVLRRVGGSKSPKYGVATVRIAELTWSPEVKWAEKTSTRASWETPSADMQIEVQSKLSGDRVVQWRRNVCVPLITHIKAHALVVAYGKKSTRGAKQRKTVVSEEESKRAAAPTAADKAQGDNVAGKPPTNVHATASSKTKRAEKSKKARVAPY